MQTVPEITPSELAQALEAGEQLQIIDVRARTGADAQPIGLEPEAQVTHIVGSSLLRFTSLEGTGIDPARPAVVICGRGNDSRVAASHLNCLGARAFSLSGGMAAWMMLSVPRALRTPPSLDHLVQFDRMGKASLSYVLISSGEAMIIDPPREFQGHRKVIDDNGAKLVAVVDTHAHADYISGAPRIVRETGVPYYLHPDDHVDPYDGTQGRIRTTPVTDGMIIRIGRCELTVLHTPGHSPGSVTYQAGNDAAFTGDFLFLSSVGRPDLADRTEEWSRLLWRSIENIRRSWPDGLMIYPAHYAPRTSRASNGAIGEPFGRLLLQNPFLQTREESRFLASIRTHASAPPATYRTIKGINLGLFFVGDAEADALELGRHECSIGDT